MEVRVIERATSNEALQLVFDIHENAFRDSPLTKDARASNIDHKRKEFGEAVTILMRVEGKKNPTSTSCIFTMKQNVRGKILLMGGLAGVATLPEARRKGNVKQIIGYFFNWMKENDHPVSGLYPFKESFYEKMGYVVLPSPKSYFFNPKALSPLLERKNIFGEVIRKELNEENLDEYFSFVEEYQKVHHGFVVPQGYKRNRITWLMERYWFAIAYDEKGKPVGMVVYLMYGLFKPMKVKNFLYFNSVGKFLLLRYFALHIDQVTEIQLQLAPGERIETWISDSNCKVEDALSPSHTGGMTRVIVVEKLSGIKVGTKEEKHFTATIEDSMCSWNNGTFVFKAKDGLLEVSRASESEKSKAFTLTIEGLTSIIYNGSKPGDLEFRGWGNPPLSDQVIMEEMFPDALPFLYEHF